MFFKKNNLNQIGDFRKKGNRFYKIKKYSNPYFQRKKKSGTNVSGITLHYSFNKLYFFIFFSLILAVLWFVLYSNYFQIDSFEIQGGERISPDEIEYLAWRQINDSYLKFLPQKNIFIFNVEHFQATLEEKYSFDELNITKKSPRKIIVKFTEKQYAFIQKEGERYYYCDENGEKINEIFNLLEISQKDYPLLEKNGDGDDNSEGIRTKDEQEKIAYMLRLFREFKAYREVFVIEKFIINNDPSSVIIKLIDGPELYFNSKEDVVKQINKVIIIKDEKLKDSFNTRQYIDVRIGDSVYYR